MLQLTGVVADRDMRAQYLDRMDIERERGITIKAQNVRLPWKVDGTDYVLHLIDTPGHVDFTYEVSRALEACEGAVLLVDAAQGIEAQTLANLYLALDRDLHIIPVLNKIDLPAADPDRYAGEIAHIIGCEPGDVLRVSGKTGEGVAELLDHVVREVPPPQGDADAPTRAMIFDSVYDIYRGVVTYVRVVDGKITPARTHRDDVHRRHPRTAGSRHRLTRTQAAASASASASGRTRCSSRSCARISTDARLTAVVGRPERAHVERAELGHGMPRGDLDGFLEAVAFEHVEARDQLLGLCERTVGDEWLAAANADDLRLLLGPELVAEQPSLLRLVQPPLELLALPGAHLEGRVDADEHEVLHGCLLGSGRLDDEPRRAESTLRLESSA